MARQLWLADVAHEAGLQVAEVSGWRDRGSSVFNPAGLVVHHTAGASVGDMPSLGLLTHGRSDLPGPLCNYGLGRSGKVYIVAAGRANHAGRGGWKGMVGNSSVIGIEAENDGRQAWPDEQIEAYLQLSFAIVRRLGNNDASLLCGHKEWAPTRKVDPHSLRMADFRANVRARFHPPKPDPVPPADDDFKRRVMAKPVLTEGAGVGDRANQFWDVGIMQALMQWHGATPISIDGTLTGRFDYKTKEGLRNWQARTGVLTPDGVCGPQTWAWLCGV